MKKGEKVRLAGYPDRYPWMEMLETETGRIEAVDDDGELSVYGVRFPGVESVLWFGASYLESAEKKEKAA